MDNPEQATPAGEATPAAAPAKPVARKPRKPRPKALIDENGCTGCEACIVVCPVDCIVKLPGPEHSGIDAVCRVDWDRCTGCTICARDCPWETIEMVTPEDAGILDRIKRYQIY